VERGELVARALTLAVALATSLLAVSGAGGGEVQTPKRGGTVVMSLEEIACLNPFACKLAHDHPVLTQVLEGAFEIGPDLVRRPNLVSHVTRTREPLTLTYHIRPEARWSDGVLVTASDFQFTHEKVASVERPAFDQRPLYAKIETTRVLGPKTFRIELREPFADWRRLYSGVLPRHALAGEDVTRVWIDRIDNPKTRTAIGSGPFLVERLERGRELTLVRNPRYWGPHTSYLDRFVFRFNLDPVDPLGPLQRNETDVALLVGAAPLTAELAQQVRDLPGWRVAAWPAPAMEHFAFRVGPGGHPALGAKLVRQALAFGIDRDAIARAVLAEAEGRPAILDSSVFLPGEPHYRPNWSRYRYDPARAQRLLQQAGCRRGSQGVHSCAGLPLRLRLVTTTGNALRERIARLVQAQLRRAGVEVLPEYAPLAPFFGQVLPRGEFDIALFRFLGLSGGSVLPYALCGNVQNFAGFCSRLLTRDAQQVDVIVDPKQRALVLNAADAKLARAVPALPVVQPLERAALRRTLRGVIRGGTATELTQNSEDWWLER
jgi:peptide/nickel transport system substrate-binding protein